MVATGAVYKGNLPLEFELQDVEGDGNCFWRSVALALNRPEEEYKFVKLEVVKTVLLNADYFWNFFEERFIRFELDEATGQAIKKIGDYADLHMIKEKCYAGTELDRMAVAKTYGRDVWVFSVGPNQDFTYQDTLPTPDKDPINLFWTRHPLHYQFLRRKPSIRTVDGKYIRIPQLEKKLCPRVSVMDLLKSWWAIGSVKVPDMVSLMGILNFNPLALKPITNDRNCRPPRTTEELQGLSLDEQLSSPEVTFFATPGLEKTVPYQSYLSVLFPSIASRTKDNIDRGVRELLRTMGPEDTENYIMKALDDDQVWVGIPGIDRQIGKIGSQVNAYVKSLLQSGKKRGRENETPFKPSKVAKVSAGGDDLLLLKLKGLLRN